MVVVAKPNGEPQRTVDLSPLNKFCKRETHVTVPPFRQARLVLAKTWMTVTDAWSVRKIDIIPRSLQTGGNGDTDIEWHLRDMYPVMMVIVNVMTKL